MQAEHHNRSQFPQVREHQTASDLKSKKQQGKTLSEPSEREHDLAGGGTAWLVPSKVMSGLLQFKQWSLCWFIRVALED